VSYSIVALISVVLGSIYLVSPQFMPYHADTLGTTWAALAPAEQMLILALLVGYALCPTGGTLLSSLSHFSHAPQRSIHCVVLLQ